MDTLIFIDTNILLDFYRSRNEASLKLLKHLDTLHDKLITTYQAEMEFKKNRQAVILESHNALKSPDSISAPAFLSEAKATKGLQRNIAGAKKRVEAMKWVPGRTKGTC
jgi:predicted nucleic acid-binding protein